MMMEPKQVPRFSSVYHKNNKKPINDQSWPIMTKNGRGLIKFTKNYPYFL